MTSLNDIKEDPSGFVIDEFEGSWRWTRLSDNTTKHGFSTRESAILDAEGTTREAK